MADANRKEFRDMYQKHHGKENLEWMGYRIERRYRTLKIKNLP